MKTTHVILMLLINAAVFALGGLTAAIIDEGRYSGRSIISEDENSNFKKITCPSHRVPIYAMEDVTVDWRNKTIETQFSWQCTSVYDDSDTYRVRAESKQW